MNNYCCSFEPATGVYSFETEINKLLNTLIENADVLSNNNFRYTSNTSNNIYFYSSNSSNDNIHFTSNTSNDLYILLSSNISNLQSFGSNTSNYTFGYLDSNLLWTQAELFKLQVEHILQKATINKFVIN